MSWNKGDTHAHTQTQNIFLKKIEKAGLARRVQKKERKLVLHVVQKITEVRSEK